MNCITKLLKPEDKEMFLTLLLAYIKECVSIEQIYPVEYNENIANEYWNELTKHADTYICFVAIINREFVGFIVGQIHDYDRTELYYYKGKKRGEAWELYTVPAMRKKGIGSVLLTSLEREFVSRGCEHMVLNNVYVESKKAQRLYEQLGFKQWTVKYYKKLLDTT